MTCQLDIDTLAASAAPPCCDSSWPTDACARPHAPVAPGEPHGAMVLVLERGARLPRSFERLREGHADVAIIAQGPGDNADAILSRAHRRLAALGSAGRCVRTVVIAASGTDGRSARARALVARALAGNVCHGCGVVHMVADSPLPGVRRQLQAVGAALEQQVAGVRVRVT